MGAHLRRKAARVWRVLPTAVVLAAGLAAGVGAAHAQQPAASQAERLTLKQTVTLALRHSPEVALANLQYDIARREAGLSRSEFLPNLYSGSGVAYTNGFPLLAGGGAPALFTLSYDQALFNPLARSDVRVAEKRAEQQHLAADNASDAVIVRAASAYLELAKVRRELDLMRRERESAQRILDFTQQRMQAGYELPIEVTKAQLTAARVEQRIAQLEDQDDTLAEQLRTMLGYPADQPIEVTAEDLPAEADQSIGELEGQAFQNNVELKQAESEHQATLEHLKGERGGYWPTVSIIGQYNILAKFNNYNQFFDKFQRNNLIVGVDVKIPIFASRTSAAVAFAQANVTAAQMTVDNKRSQLSLDVRHKARQVKEMDTAREVNRLELELAQQNLEVLQAQFQQGRASLRDLEAAQLDENDKWLAFLDSDFARQQAQLDLLRTTGQVAKLFQ